MKMACQSDASDYKGNKRGTERRSRLRRDEEIAKAPQRIWDPTFDRAAHHDEDNQYHSNEGPHADRHAPRRYVVGMTRHTCPVADVETPRGV